MAAPPATPVSWTFDAVTVDPATFRVLVNGVPQALEPKSFRLLQFLIEHRDRVVSKEEIFQAVWAGAFVTDIAKTTVFVTDLTDFGAMNEVYGAFFGQHRPARSTVQVAALPGGAKVEIEAWAYVPHRTSVR